MLAILNSLNAHYIPIFQPILIILLSTFMVHRAITDKTYLLLGLLSPLSHVLVCSFIVLNPTERKIHFSENFLIFLGI